MEYKAIISFSFDLHCPMCGAIEFHNTGRMFYACAICGYVKSWVRLVDDLNDDNFNPPRDKGWGHG